MPKFEYDARCKSCGGTGIYVGLAEGGGVGVVCATCKGTGAVHIVVEWDDYEGKVKRNDIQTVLEVNPGIMVSGDLDIGGISYSDWFEGKGFPKGSEMRNYVCPLQWYQNVSCDKALYQNGSYDGAPYWNVNYEGAKSWKECVTLGEWFSECRYVLNKAKCWERFDSERLKACRQKVTLNADQK